MDLNKIEKPKKKPFLFRYLKSLKNTLIPLFYFIIIGYAFFGTILAIGLSMVNASMLPIIIHIIYIILVVAYVNMERY